MKVGTLLLVFHDLIEDLVSLGVLDSNGNLFGTALDSLQENLELVAVVEKRLKQHGVVIKDEIDKVINALPLILALLK